jgi:hexosaminidase
MKRNLNINLLITSPKKLKPIITSFILTNFFILLTFFFTTFLISNTQLVCKPIVIPSIKEWEPSFGKVALTASSRIVYDNNSSDELKDICNTLKEDIKALKNWDLPLVASGQPADGDIFLKLTDSSLNEEDYYMIVYDNKVTIEGKYKKGVFWGTRTLLQLLKQNDTLECGIAKDYPDYPERGLMVDMGRKYFPVQWIENHIRELSYLKMNLFHWHLSDNEGFRLQCDRYPEIVSKQYYTKDEIKYLANLAQKYFIEIIPEIDMPNHMSYMLKHFPELWLTDSLGNKAGSCCIDFTMDSSRNYITNILNEYIPLFNGKFWHLGCDEYITDFGPYPQFEKWAKRNIDKDAQPEESYFGFINWADSIAKSYNKRLRVWNDWSNKQLDKTFKSKVNNDIIIEYWEGDYPAQKFIDGGYQTINCSSWHLYYVLASAFINYELLYKEFVPLLFNKYQSVTDLNEQVSGAKFHIWNDYSPTPIENEYQIANTVSLALRVLSEKTWNSVAPKNEFKQFVNYVNLLGKAPLFVEPDNPTPNNLVFNKKVTASSCESITDLMPENINDGYNTTRWSSAYTDKEWIYFDLGERKKFTTVKLYWEYSFATDYALQISDDGVNWSDIYAKTNGKGWLEVIDNLNAESRYLKLDCRKRNGWNGFSLWEIEVYDSNKIISYYPEPIDKKLFIYPNPVKDYVIVPGSEQNYTDVFIYTIEGTLVQVINTWDGKIYVGNLYSGLYILRTGNEKYLLIKSD